MSTEDFGYDKESLCDFCGIAPRVTALIVCSTCYGVKIDDLLASFKDPNAAHPHCRICNALGTSIDIGLTCDQVSLMMIEGQNGWICIKCFNAEFGDGNG